MSLKVTSHGSSKDTVSTEVSCNIIRQPIFIGTCFFVRGKTAIPFEHYSQDDMGELAQDEWETLKMTQTPGLHQGRGKEKICYHRQIRNHREIS